MQVVADGVELPWAEADLSGLDAAVREEELERLLARDRATRFDLATAPLLRVLLVGVGAGEYRLVLTNHHILLDGWSVPLLVRELLVLYAAGGDGAALGRVRPYRDYLVWLAGRDAAASRAAWASALAGLDEPTLLAPAARARELSTVPGETHREWSVAATAALTALARERAVTANTMVQVAWGIVLATETGRAEVVFGATVSGRSAAGARHRGDDRAVHQHRARADRPGLRGNLGRAAAFGCRPSRPRCSTIISSG